VACLHWQAVQRLLLVLLLLLLLLQEQCRFVRNNQDGALRSFQVSNARFDALLWGCKLVNKMLWY
jgi:hypothetical protein